MSTDVMHPMADGASCAWRRWAVAAGLLAGLLAGPALAAPFEADTAPRAQGGDDALTIIDWVQTGRFAAGLDTAVPGLEFQKADCAPRATLGDGEVTIID